MNGLVRDGLSEREHLSIGVKGEKKQVSLWGRMSRQMVLDRIPA